MPSSRAILSDIADLKLDPSKAYTVVKASGRLSAVTAPAVVDHSETVEVKQSPVVVGATAGSAAAGIEPAVTSLELTDQLLSVEDVLLSDSVQDVKTEEAQKVDDVKKKDDKKKKDKKVKSSDEVEPPVVSDPTLD